MTAEAETLRPANLSARSRTEDAARASSMAASPRASVLIVNYNGGEALRNCLRSLVEEDARDREIVLVDNGSTDGSADYVECSFPEVTTIRSPANLGFGGGNNLAARRANGEYLIFLNPDTVVTPGWSGALVAALEADPTAGLSTSRILLLADPDRVNTCGNDLHLAGLALCRGMGESRESWDRPSEVAAVSGAAFAVRRELFMELDGFDEQFFLYMEDTDLSLRARLAGYRCVYVPDSVVCHDYALRFGPRKTFYQERNRYLLLLKALRWRTLAALLPVLLLAEAVTWGFQLVREPLRIGNKLGAYCWILGRWGRMLAARRRTQELRRVPDLDLLAVCTHRLAFEQTGDGFAARGAHLVFDPLFWTLRRLALAVVRW